MTKRLGGHDMGRLQRVYSVTGCYHIMLRGNEKKSIFIDQEHRRKFLLILTNKKTETDISIYAFCLMDKKTGRGLLGRN